MVVKLLDEGVICSKQRYSASFPSGPRRGCRAISRVNGVWASPSEICLRKPSKTTWRSPSVSSFNAEVTLKLSDYTARVPANKILRVVNNFAYRKCHSVANDRHCFAPKSTAMVRQYRTTSLRRKWGTLIGFERSTSGA